MNMFVCLLVLYTPHCTSVLICNLTLLLLLLLVLLLLLLLLYFLLAPTCQISHVNEDNKVIVIVIVIIISPVASKFGPIACTLATEFIFLFSLSSSARWQASLVPCTLSPSLPLCFHCITPHCTSVHIITSSKFGPMHFVTEFDVVSGVHGVLELSALPDRLRCVTFCELVRLVSQPSCGMFFTVCCPRVR